MHPALPICPECERQAETVTTSYMSGGRLFPCGHFVCLTLRADATVERAESWSDVEVMSLDCDGCNDTHAATYSHDSTHGQGPIFAVICPVDDLTSYHTVAGVEVVR